MTDENEDDSRDEKMKPFETFEDIDAELKARATANDSAEVAETANAISGPTSALTYEESAEAAQNI